ncbi:NUDIX domain-containing protein [Caulobacter sp. DWR2-3-1b2]|uniref:NUDIX domain-containing protein n=1 Tax=unclassified Caulobacter TaxID=2648921 RepID=UPI0019A47876|nr:NUDIX domain-containing protein [Caulobacter sp.]
MSSSESPGEPLRPRIGCGAAILDTQSRLLLVKRRRQPEAGHWGQPGGKLDWGESARACAEREILEELGITVVAGPVLCVTDMIAEDSHWVAVTYRADGCVGEPVIQEPAALEAWGWFALDDLPSPLTLATQDAVRQLLT